MTIKINYLKKSDYKKSSNIVLFVNENFDVKKIKRFFSNSEFVYVNDLLRNCNLKKNLFVFEINSKKK